MRILLIILLFPSLLTAQIVSRNKSFQNSGTTGVSQYSGTTAQRPTGDLRWLRWNSDSSRIEVKINSGTWRALLFNGEGGGTGTLTPADTVGRFWSLSGNTLGATKNFGSTDNNHIQFIANNSVVGGLAANGEFRFGSNTDRGAFAVQCNGRTIVMTGAANNFMVEDDGANGNNATSVLNIGSNSLANLLLTTPASANTLIIRDYGQTTNLFTIGADNNVELTHLLTDAATSGTKRAFSAQNTFNPTSGTAVRYAFEDATTVNQTGGANGIYASFYAHPTLTAAADARAFWNTTGNNKLNTTSGNTLIGTATDDGSGAKLQVNGDATVADEAYDATAWNGSLEVPTKNAIRDKIESLGSITSINSQTGPSITISGDATNGITVSASSNTVTVASNADLESFGSDANNTGTSETDLYSHTLLANKLTLNGKGVRFRITGTNNDATATAQIKGYFAGNNIFDSGALTMSAAGDWVIDMEIQRTSSTAAAATVTFSCANTTVTLPVKYTALTGLDWTSTNIFKVTGTAGGGGGGSNDITSHAGKVVFVP